MEESSAQDPDLHLDLLKLDLDLKLDIIEKAENGDSFAQLDIGKACYSAINLENNCEKAYKWFHLSANQNNMEAQYKLGEMYAFGQGTKKNEHAAYDWYLKSALQGYSKALIRIYDLYHAEKNMHCRGQIDASESEWADADFKKTHQIRELNEYRIEQYKSQLTSSIPYFEKLFKKCHEQIKDEKQEEKQDFYLKLGFLYQHGYGIRKIMTRSIEYYTLAAEKGNTDAQYNLGFIYQHTLRKDWSYIKPLKWSKLAFNWLLQAAENGNCNAQNHLAFFFMKGLGTDRNYTKAAFWYQKAAEGRNVEAMISLASLYRKGETVGVNEELAVKWYKMAIAEGSTVAQSSLELLQYNKITEQIKKNEIAKVETARSFSKKGLHSRLRSDVLSIIESTTKEKLEKIAFRTLRNDPESMLHIGWMYLRGDYFKQDKIVGLKWITQAANGGSIKAQHTIAKFYKDGVYTQQNYNRAYVWYSKMANSGDLEAQYYLGKMYYEGIGVRKDPLEASRWYTVAALKNHSGAQCQLGVLRLNGEGLRKDLDEAMAWFRKSFEQRDPETFNILAILCETVQGVESNEKVLHILYGLYGLRRSIKPDPDWSLKLYKTAANLGCIDAQLKLAGYYSETKRKNYKVTATYYEKASVLGNAKAKYELAIMYLDGKGVNQDFIKAYYLFKESQQLEHKPAENLFHVPIDYLKTDNIDYNKLMLMFALVCKKSIASLEYNLGCHYQVNRIFKYDDRMLTCIKNVDLAKRWLRIAANNCIFDAHYRLYDTQLQECVTNKGFQKPIIYPEGSSNNGSHSAAYRLGCMYLEGDSITQDLRKAFHLLYVASSSGCKKAAAILNLSDISHLNTTRDTILRMLEEGAASGNTITQYRLATLKLDVESYDYDIKGAVHYLAMASDGGYIDASYRLGLLFDEGAQVTQDYDKAGKYYQIAAEKRHEVSLFRLALLYHFGRGRDQDYLKAHKLYCQAAREGSNLAQMAIDVVERSTWESKKSSLNYLLDGILFDYDNYLQMWEHVAEMGDSNLQYKLGAIYETSSLDAAIKWHSKAAEHSHDGALFSLGLIYETRAVTSQDYEKAIELYKRSIEKNNDNALYQLGIIYLHGKHIKIDIRKSFRYLERAALLGNEKAQLMLGKLYEQGDVLPRDWLKSIHWYSVSDSQGNYEAQCHLHCIMNHDYTSYPEKIFRILHRIVDRDLRYQNFFDKSFYGFAIYKLGLSYYHGIGTTINYRKALQCFRTASNRYQNQNAAKFSTFQFENIKARDRYDYLKKLQMFVECIEQLTEEEIYELVLVYYHGIYPDFSDLEADDTQPIIRPDHLKALHYLHMLARRGSFYVGDHVDNLYEKCSYYLGLVNYIETVHEKDSTLVEKYFDNAYRAGNAEARELLMSIKSGEAIKEMSKKVHTWYERHSYRANSKILYHIGYMYENGIGAESDFQRAGSYYEMAANRGYSEAHFKLGSLCHQGHEIKLVFNRSIIETLKEDPDYDDILNFMGLLFRDIENSDYSNTHAYKKHFDVTFDLEPLDHQNHRAQPDYKNAVLWYALPACRGHTDAMNNIGLFYRDGIVVEQSFERAFEHFKTSADKGHADAAFNLGNLYRQGQGVQIDYKKLFECYTVAAGQGHVEANYKLGELYEQGEGIEKNFTNAFQCYRISAKKDNPNAQFKLACFYQEGLGVEANFQTAIEWYIRAANNDHIEANYKLGGIYLNGHGVEKNPEEALKYYIAAGEKDYVDAQLKLGYMYRIGYGIEINHKEAMKWYSKAAEQNNGESNYHLGVLYENGDGVEMSYEEAIKYFRTAANKGHIGAQFKLGFFYQQGLGVDLNYEGAIYWYNKAAEKNDSLANYNLGIMYNRGYGVQQNYNTALKHYKLSANQGYVYAQFKVAYFYHQGYGVGVDYKGAIEWYTKAVEQGDIISNYNLGIIHENGDSVQKNIDRAKQYFKKASEQGYTFAKSKLNSLEGQDHTFDQRPRTNFKWYNKPLDQNHIESSYNIE